MSKQPLENLDKLLKQIQTMGFFSRLFFWNNIKSLSYDAYEEFKSIDKKTDNINEELNEKNLKLKEAETNLKNTEKEIIKLESEIKLLKEQKQDLGHTKSESEKKIKEFETKEQQKQQEYDLRIERLNELKDQLQKDKERIQQEREQEIIQRFEDMKKQWKVHEDYVEQSIKRICSKYVIPYISKGKVPFKGSPDNTLQIAKEYIIFDAKSPHNEDLNNFPTYLKSQAKIVQKYAKEKNVKKDIFLVVPSNTVEALTQFSYNMVDYYVYVITIDALEPIILSLQKIEDYEFTDQLSPEERQHICRIIGKFAHTTKRRIQVDHFFSKEFIDILNKCYDLPKEILDGTIEAEKSGMLNPPMEKRAKRISSDKLKDETKRIKREAEAKNIAMEEDLSDIEKVRLDKEK